MAQRLRAQTGRGRGGSRKNEDRRRAAKAIRAQSHWTRKPSAFVLIPWPDLILPQLSISPSSISPDTMHWWHSALQLSLLASAALPAAVASWGFADATVSVQTKGAGVGAGSKEEYDAFH